MPQIQRYTVERTQFVKVAAYSPEDAARIAVYAFEHGQNSDNAVSQIVKVGEGHPLNDVWGNTTGPIEVTNLNVSKEF